MDEKSITPHTLQTTSPMKQLNTLVFGGGGLKGLMYVGVYKALEELNQLKNIKKLIGTSIGAQECLFMVLGYSAKEIIDYTIEWEMKDIQDITIHTILKSTESYGIDSGVNFTKFYKKIITTKGHPENITLLEIYNITKIHFITTATCIEEFKCYYIDYLTFPNMPLWMAVRISANIPFIYPPFEYENKHYIDGGIIDNNPIHFMKEDLDNSLAFIITDNIYSNPLESAFSYISSVIKCFNENMNSDKLNEFHDNIIYLEIENVKFYEATFSLEKKTKLIESGYKQTINKIEAFITLTEKKEAQSKEN
jgi:NTE family protein